MNIKSLLIGSAAALVAVSGARAADAVVAEPEAVEYVRVCDAYGAGFFYIPGTETCLKIGGYVRYQINFSDADDGWRKYARANLQFTASSETELGTLTSYIEYELGRGFTDADVASSNNSFQSGSLNQAWISLGGLSMGWNVDGQFDGGINGEFDVFGGAGAHFIKYTFSGGNGFTASLALESEDYNVDYMPNVVGKVSYSAGMFGVDVWAAYDDDALGITNTNDEFALKAIVTAKASDALTLQLGATYNSDDNYYSNGYDWSVGASAKYQVNEKLALTLGGQYFADDHFDNAGILDFAGGDAFSVGTVVDYTIVKDFTAKLAVNYTDIDVTAGDGSFVDGFLRFQRSF